MEAMGIYLVQTVGFYYQKTWFTCELFLNLNKEPIADWMGLKIIFSEGQ